MIAISLQSGSNGNCIYVETGGVKLLFRRRDQRRRGRGAARPARQDIRQVDAVIISHDHGDHIRCAGVFQRKYGLPVHVTARTLAAARSRCELGRLHDIRNFKAGGTLRFKDVSVHTVPTPHDSDDGAAFVIEGNGKRLGILTDLGHVFSDLGRLVSSLDAVFLESNYDPEMLKNGPYPATSSSASRARAGTSRTPRPRSCSERRGPAPALGLPCPPFEAEQQSRPRTPDPPRDTRPGLSAPCGKPLRRFGHLCCLTAMPPHRRPAFHESGRHCSNNWFIIKTGNEFIS